MREETLRQLMFKLGMFAVERRHDRKKDAIWLNHSCPLSTWTHQGGTDRTASFGIVVNDRGTSIFKCWACKQTGSTAKLVRLLAHYRQQNLDGVLDLAEEGEKGLRTYAAFDEVPPEPFQPEPLEEAMWDGLFEPIAEGTPAGQWLASRKVSIATATKLNLGFDPDQQRVVFPVRGRDGALYGFSGRSILPKERLGKYPKVRDYAGLPKEYMILGADRWTRGRRKLLVEGLIAFARMHEIGAEEFVDIGALLGAELLPFKADIVREEGDTAILLMDPDPAGDAGTFGRFDAEAKRNMIETSAIGLLWGHVPVVVPDFPDMGEDPDVDNLTLDQLRGMLATRMWRPDPAQAKALRMAGLQMGGGY